MLKVEKALVINKGIPLLVQHDVGLVIKFFFKVRPCNQAVSEMSSFDQSVSG